MTYPQLAILVSVALSSPFKKDDLSIELIRQAYLEGRDRAAVVLADRALIDSGGDSPSLRAEIHFWRGAALRRLGRNEESLVALDAARDLGFPGMELRFERALVLRALGRQEEAEREYREAERQGQEDPQKLEDLRRRWKDASDLDSRLQLRLNPQFGYDTNIIAINDNTVLADDFDRQSVYYGAQILARFLAFQEKETTLRLDYQNNLRGYATEPGLSYTDNLLSLLCQSPVGKLDWMSYEIRASWGEAWLQGEGHFRTLGTVAPAILFRPEEKWLIRLWGDLTNAEYHSETPVEQDRDGVIYRGGLATSIELEGGWSLAPHLTYWSYRADGDDYDHQAWDLGAGITTPEFSGLQIRLDVGVIFGDYDNLHSLTNYTEERSDRRYSVRLTIIFRQLEKTLGFAPSVSVGYEKWISNIAAFDFDRFDLGGSADILAWSF